MSKGMGFKEAVSTQTRPVNFTVALDQLCGPLTVPTC